MNKNYLGIGAFVLVSMAVLAFAVMPIASSESKSAYSVAEKIYVALEDEGKIAVIDASTNQVIRDIDLTENKNGEVHYMAHNVQVAPDGSAVYVTANVDDKSMQMQMGADMEMSSTHPDEIIIIDPKKDTIKKRIPIEPEAHLAHVVNDAKKKTLWVTLQQKDKVDEVDLTSGKVVRSIELATKSAPHGLRISADGSRVFIALMGKGVAMLDTNTGAVEIKSQPGRAVQTAVTQDNAYAFASVYDTKQIAWYSLKEGTEGLIDLPLDARGPVQIYPTPDSKYLYVADQGYYFDQPNGTMVYRIDVATKKVDASVVGGSAPHGVVVSKDGSRVYVTNILGNDLSVIDTRTNKETARIRVGSSPNGISIWNAVLGGMP